MKPKLVVLADDGFDCSDFDVARLRGDPSMQAAWDAVHAELPPRARGRASSRLNPQHETTEAIRKLVAWWRDGALEQSAIVVLSGKPGNGKTTAASWLAVNRWTLEVQGGFAFRWRDAPVLARQRVESEAHQDLVSDAEASGLIVLDDLGVEHLPSPRRVDEWRAALDELVDATYRSSTGVLLITTNLIGAEFRERYGPRITDRFRECGVWLGIESESMRGGL